MTPDKSIGPTSKDFLDHEKRTKRRLFQSLRYCTAHKHTHIYISKKKNIESGEK